MTQGENLSRNIAEEASADGVLLRETDKCEVFINRHAGHQAKDLGVSSSHPFHPPDSGYGWIIVAACFTVYLILGGWRRSYSVFLIQIKETYGTSTAIAAWLGGAATAGVHILSPISTVLVHHSSTRAVVMTGGVLMALSSFLSAFAPQTGFLFFTYSFLTGVGGTCIVSPSLVLLSQYFEKKSGLAHGIASAGGGFGGLLFPLLVEFLFSEYYYRGCFMIMSGVLLHLVVCGCLMRPVNDQHRTNQESTAAFQQVQSNEDATLPPGRQRFSCSTLSQLCHRIVTSDTYILYKSTCTPTFLVFLFAMGLSLAVLFANWFLITEFALTRGIPITKAVLLSSVGSIVDLAFRVITGLLFDTRLMRGYRVLNFNLMVLVNGVVMLLLAFTYSYYLMMLLMMFQYISAAVMFAQRQVIIADLFGLGTLMATVPLTLMAQGLGFLIIPAGVGFLFDQTGSYVVPYIVAGILGILSAVLFRLAVRLSESTRIKTEKTVKT